MRALVASAPPAGRAGRALLVVAAAAVLVSTLSIATLLMTDQVERFPVVVHHLEIDGDYVVYATLFGMRDTRMLYWNGEGDQKPDRVLLTRAADVERVLAGQPPQEIIQEFEAVPHGRVVFQGPTTSCELPGGQCSQSSPIILFLRGDAWIGHDLSEFERSQIEEYKGDGVAVEWPAPLSFGGGTVHTATLRAIPVWYAICGAAVLAALVGALLLLRARPSPPPTPALSSPPTADMLVLASVIDLHARSVERSLWTSAALIPTIGAVAWYVTIEDWLDAAFGHWIEMPYPASTLLLLWAIPFVTLVAGVLLLARWREVRAELAAWRALRARLDAEAAAILDG